MRVLLTLIAQVLFGAWMAALAIAGFWWLASTLYLMPVKGQIGFGLFCGFVVIVCAWLSRGAPPKLDGEG